jgi:aminopeptidase N
MVKLILRTQLLFAAILLMASANTFAGSGGPLSPEQAAYDVNYYALDLTIDPVAKTIDGSLLCRAVIVSPIDTFVLNLDNPFTVDSILFRKEGGEYSNVDFTHTDGKLRITIPISVTTGDIIMALIYYNGAPRIASNPPWDDGFVWETTSTGKPWIGVACETGGADIWWPCKDHPSDEPDSMSMSFTVPDPLICVSNGRYLGSVNNGNNTTTFNWFISTPINNYNVSIYIAEYSLIEDTYISVNNDSIPFYFWVIPEDYNTAINHMGVFLTEFNFLESICGPFPFGTDKHGWAHSSYWGMEHQTIIAYGHNFTVNSWGFDYIHYHELAHEWWGNLITAKDWADVWIHEGLATYTEALYVEHMSGMSGYHQFMYNKRPNDNHSHPLAPREALTADEAFSYLNSYSRGSSVMHTLRFHLGDAALFNLLERWAYPDSSDFNNTNGRLCRILTTDDMKDQAEDVTGLELDPFFEVFFREITYPVLNVVRGINEATFTWETESNVLLDLDIPIRVNGTDQIVEMTDGEGSAAISINDNLVIDPEKWILMADPVIVTSLNGDVTEITDYRLEQNYPNPFNPTTTINYSIPEQSNVKIIILDALGREVTTLVTEEKSIGNYTVEFNASYLSSGIYFYQIRTNEFIQTKKMILLR